LETDERASFVRPGKKVKNFLEGKVNYKKKNLVLKKTCVCRKKFVEGKGEKGAGREAGNPQKKSQLTRFRKGVMREKGLKLNGGGPQD